MANAPPLIGSSIRFCVLVAVICGNSTWVGAGPFAYITNAFDNNVSVIDAETRTVLDTIPVGREPVGSAVLPDGTAVYVANLGDDSVSIIQTATNSVIHTVSVGQGPFGVASHSQGRFVYVSNSEASSISVIDTSTIEVIDTITVGASPVGIAVDSSGEALYVTHIDDGILSIIETPENEVLATVDLGESSQPFGIAVKPDDSLVYVALAGDPAGLAIVDPVSHSVVKPVSSSLGTVGAAIHPDGARLYLTNFFTRTVSVIDTATFDVVATVVVGRGPAGVDVNPDGGTIYVVNSEGNSVSVIDAEDMSVIQSIGVGDAPSVLGRFFGPLSQQYPDLGGSVSNQLLWRVRCVNRETGQHVRITDPTTETVWNCEEGGLCVDTGDEVRITIWSVVE